MPTSASPAVAYVANADSHNICVVELDRQQGTMRALQTVDAGGAVMPLALAPGRRFLYASLRSEPYAVASFAVDPATGALQRIGSAPLPDSMASITVDGTGRWLFAASYSGHKISVSPIGTDGVAGAAAEVIATGKNAHAVVIDPANRNLLVTNLGSDQVLVFRFDAGTGKLCDEPFVLRTREGAGPRHIALHPDGRHAYLLHELDATVDLLAFDADRGTLEVLRTWPTLPHGSTVKPWAADIHITPDGRFLYTSERNSSTLAIWQVAANGELTLVGQQATETRPRGFQIDSTGQWLLAAGQSSHQMTAYRIDSASGRVTPTARLAMGLNPNWIEIIDLR